MGRQEKVVLFLDICVFFLRIIELRMSQALKVMVKGGPMIKHLTISRSVSSAIHLRRVEALVSVAGRAKVQTSYAS